ncbi:reverse transcriptase domain-containing protein [Tanacetum coccineum]
MMDVGINNVENRVIHTVKIDMVRQIVDVENSGKSADEIDKETVSFAECDMKATNIILQGLPSDIYSLVNHHKVAKDLWERVQLLMQALHTTNYDQLHAYLEQHELHANGVCIMRERNQDPLALGRQNSYVASTSGTRANTSGIRGNYLGQQRVVKCFNCQGEGHMARQCLKLKRKRDATWFRDKVLLVEAQGNEGPVIQSSITHNATYQADDLDAYVSDCDEISTAKAVIMANLSSYDSDVLFEVPHSDNTHNDMLNQSVQEMSYSKQTHLVNYPENEITSDNNIIPYSQYLLDTQNAVV